jgi:hypothetical protein
VRLLAPGLFHPVLYDGSRSPRPCSEDDFGQDGNVLGGGRRMAADSFGEIGNAKSGTGRDPTLKNRG